MKLSGAFSEFGEEDPWPIGKICEYLRFWVSFVFREFGADRVMFGSDWPVCNVKGPKGEGSWPVWREAVETLMEGLGVDEKGKERIWWGTSAEAYGLGLGEEKSVM